MARCCFGVKFVLLAQLCHGLVFAQRRQRHLGLELGIEDAPRTTCRGLLAHIGPLARPTMARLDAHIIQLAALSRLGGPLLDALITALR